MYPSQRQEKIMEILKADHYSSVKYLEETLHYSSSTISRDINQLVRQGLVQKTYGGVAIVEDAIVPRHLRQSYKQKEKINIARVASEYIEDGDIIFLDGSTTTQFISGMIANVKDLTIVTNNLELACTVSSANNKVICLGGDVIELPGIVSGDFAVDNASKIKVDKLFFSTYSFSQSGEIMMKTTHYYQMLKMLLAGAKKKYYLADDKKIELSSNYVLTTFEEIDYVISNHHFSENIKKKFPKTNFIESK